MERTLIGDRYELRDVLGGGGMGKVFLARDRSLDRDVALKVLREQYAESGELVERFEREAKAAASLNHPHIVAVYDRGKTEDDRYFIAMEHVSGGTLGDLIFKEGSLGAGETARLGIQITDALGAAHERGIVHRDIKPQNVLLTASGDAKMADFGIARAVSAAPTSDGSFVLGTAKYMSPEQAMGQTAGPASDLYSLGVVLYEMLTGEVPFEADSPVGVVTKHATEPPRPPREANPLVPDALNAVVMRLLEKKPENRHPDAAALAADLGRAREGLPPAPGAPTEPYAAPAAGSSRRRGFLRGLVVVAALLALLGLAGWGLSRDAGGPVVGSLGGAGRDAIEEVQRSLRLGEGEVPDVGGLTEEEARERLEKEGFGVAIERRESSEADEGRVLEQSVAAGEAAERGARIALAVGDGPRTVGAPDLLGLGPDEAEERIKEAGLKVGESEGVPSGRVPEGGVVAQDPPVGERIERGAEIDLKISSGPPERGAEKVYVPDVSGLGAGEALARLREAGCEVTGTRTEPGPEPEGTVVGTDPPVGSAVAAGAPVTVIVSGGPQTPDGVAPGVDPPAGDPPASPDGTSASSSSSATASPSSPDPDPPQSSPAPEGSASATPAPPEGSASPDAGSPAPEERAASPTPSAPASSASASSEDEDEED